MTTTKGGGFNSYNKILLAPSFEIFNKDSQKSYFDGEENIKDKWKQIENKKE